MADDDDSDDKKKERSPSFPFISLEKAVDRARLLHDKYRKEPARVSVVGSVWNYGAKSSGLLQTVAALKQYGLVEDTGSGPDRKIHLTSLAQRILLDTRPGAREQAVREAALRPRLFNEYAPRWAAHRPPDEHSISELSLERGFSAESAKLFLRAFYDTVAYAGLTQDDALSSSLDEPEEVAVVENQSQGAKYQAALASGVLIERIAHTLQGTEPPPFTQRLKVEMTVGALSVSAVLVAPSEVDKLIQILQANKLLLTEPVGEA